ncbi:MAG: FG-GAP repeat protein, partial [Prosthecobacter sp.]|nr:FG-GAP repeat protein [Prosthecobacter sp.]
MKKFHPLTFTAIILATLVVSTPHALAQGVAQQAYVKASNPDLSDLFGNAVAISGDTMVVGAYVEDSNATGINGDQENDNAFDSGAAYVYVRSGGVWTQQAYLKASNTAVIDGFGTSVAISGDIIVVGSPEEDSDARGINGDQTNNNFGASGAVYVFVRNGGVWTQEAYLKASNADSADRFGIAVAMSGNTLIVGAMGEDSNATGVNGNQANNSLSGAGAAYVFVRNGSTWTQQAYLKASNPGALDEYGRSVAISGDNIVVGTALEDSDATG